MALSLGVSGGSKIDISLADQVVTIKVDRIHSASHLTLIVKGRKVEIDDKERVEILPEVFVSCGLSQPTRGNRSTRIAFEAPIEIGINRVKKASV